MATATELPFLVGTNPRSASSAVGKGPTTDPHVLSTRGLRVSDTRSEHEPNLARNAPVGYQPVNERGDGHLVIAALLHDAIEDSEVPRDLIAETFGDDVASKHTIWLP